MNDSYETQKAKHAAARYRAEETMITASASDIALLNEIERLKAENAALREALTEIVAVNRRVMYERCPDCDKLCNFSTGCLSCPLSREGEIAKAALEVFSQEHGQACPDGTCAEGQPRVCEYHGCKRAPHVEGGG